MCCATIDCSPRAPAGYRRLAAVSRARAKRRLRGAPLAAAGPPAGPRVGLARKVGQGFSGPVVVGGRADPVSPGRRSRSGRVARRAHRTPQWQYAYPTAYRDDFGFDEGPRAVPVVVDGIVYTFGAEGQLHAVDLATRQEALERGHGAGSSACRRASSAPPDRRSSRTAASSPTSAAEGAASSRSTRDTGTVAWTATDDEASYSSPVAATIGGQRYAIFLTRAGLVGLDPADRRGPVSARVAGARRTRRSTPRRRSSSAI